jgi:prepilin-type processing-associated H-X9-DG protein
MPGAHPTDERDPECHGAFTLVELLVVIAMITTLTAILLPVLGRVRQLGRRTACQGNLRQVSMAWFVYFSDHNGKALQGLNADIAFAGWEGYLLPLGLPRPLNPHLSLPLVCTSELQAVIVKCPADTGRDERYKMPIHASHGNSYRTNIWIIGPDQTNRMDRNPTLTDALNDRGLRNLNIWKADSPSRLLLVGDHHWVDQWWDPLPEDPEQARQELKKKEWHGVPQHFNMAFLDGHVVFFKIPQGQYDTDQYTVIPCK